jgi:hypothetical protein
MFEKIMWSFFIVVNLLAAFYNAKVNNIGMELINLVTLYISWKELKNV